MIPGQPKAPGAMIPPATGLRILVIEDEPDIASLLSLHLQDIQAAVTTAADGREGLMLAQTQSWDVLLLDLRLPSLDGLEVCKALRAEGNQTPIMMVTSRISELDRVLGLEIGADDYLAKPFSVAEVKARVKALVRRSRMTQPQEEKVEPIQCFGLRINPKTRLAWLHDSPLDLTAREFDLLWFFASQPGEVFKRSELLDKVWGYGHDGYEHTVNSHINRLRNKLKSRQGEPPLIETVWGVGYRFRPIEATHP